MLTKRLLGEKILNRLKSQKEVYRNKKSFLIKEKLFRLPEFRKAETILFYLAFDKEVETRRMIIEALLKGKQIALPVILTKTNTILPFLISNLGSDIQIGPYGIDQPKASVCKQVPLGNIDLVIVPGLAFDKQGNRLGRGKGFYDRFLNRLPKKTLTIGLAFNFQVQDSIPHSSGDLPVKKVLSA